MSSAGCARLTQAHEWKDALGSRVLILAAAFLAGMPCAKPGAVSPHLVGRLGTVTTSRLRPGELMAPSQATKVARAMVTRYGMSDKFGMIFVEDHREEGDDVRAAIDAEVSASQPSLASAP